ncbi:MAG: hypothetical protein CMJ07_07310 [Pelagibacterales bacterium]|nr:hypothetical protein [Pelagibacterales bacterium]OUV26797.1 MAG: hypothetical protein CBC69_05450 [Alphaproteobacteria bacterium TMED109]
MTASFDNKNLYYADTYKKLIYKTSLYKNKPYIKNANIFVDNSNVSGFPDGSTVDSNNTLWNAEWNGGQVAQYDKNGKIISKIKTPMKKPTCVAFGGPNMNKLFITSAKDINSNEDDTSGKTICIQMNVKGQLSNRYILNL